MDEGKGNIYYPGLASDIRAVAASYLECRRKGMREPEPDKLHIVFHFKVRWCVGARALWGCSEGKTCSPTGSNCGVCKSGCSTPRCRWWRSGRRAARWVHPKCQSPLGPGQGSVHVTVMGRQHLCALLGAVLGQRWQRQRAPWMWWYQCCWRGVSDRLTGQSRWDCGPPMLPHEEVFVCMRLNAY